MFENGLAGDTEKKIMQVVDPANLPFDPEDPKFDEDSHFTQGLSALWERLKGGVFALTSRAWSTP